MKFDIIAEQRIINCVFCRLYYKDNQFKQRKQFYSMINVSTNHTICHHQNTGIRHKQFIRIVSVSKQYITNENLFNNKCENYVEM